MFGIESNPVIKRLLALANSWLATQTIADGVLLRWGTDGDTGSASVVSTLANTAITGLLEGTPVTPLAIAADSLVIGNITNNGDIMLAVSKAGTSHMGLMLDGSTGDTLIQASTGQSVDVYIAGAKQIDYAAGAMAFQQATTISTTATTLTLNPATDVVITDAKGLIVGNATQLTFQSTIPEVQVLGTANHDSNTGIARFSANAFGAIHWILKSRGATIGSQSALLANDQIGGIAWAVDDGVDYVSAGAYIMAYAEANYAENDVPTYLSFQTTADTEATPTERLRISSAGVLSLGTADQSTTAATGNTFRASDMVGGTTSNAAGADLTIGAGLGTGTGDVGQIIFSTPRTTGAGTGIQSRTTCLVLDANVMTFNGGGIFQSDGATEIGIAVTNGALTVGSLGSLIIPVKTDTGAPVDASMGNLDGAFGFNSFDNTLEVRDGTDTYLSVGVAGYVIQRSVPTLVGGLYHTAQYREPTIVDETRCTVCGDEMQPGNQVVMWANGRVRNDDLHAIFGHPHLERDAVIQDLVRRLEILEAAR